MSIFYGLDTSFRHYVGAPLNNILKMRHINRPQSNGKVFSLYSPHNRLLPFQVNIPSDLFPITVNTFTIESWRIVRSYVVDPFDSGLVSGTDYNDMLGLLFISGANINDYVKITNIVGKGVYFIGFMNPTKVLPNNAVMGEGDWYSVIKLKDGIYIVSEDFTVPCDAANFFTKDNLVMLEWSNTKDAFDILYQFNNFFSYFRNRIYLETDLYENEPTIIEEGVQNDKGEFILQTTSYVDNYTLQELVPEYIYRALLIARAHDTLKVTARGGMISGNMTIRECSINWQETGIDGVVRLQLEYERKDMSKCDSNYVQGSPIPIVANNDFVEVYPIVGPVNYNVLANDTGVGLTVTPLINATVGTIKISMNSNGTFSITQSGAITNTVHNINYNVRDFLNSSATGLLQIRISDWYPIDDYVPLSLGLLLSGQRVFNLGSWSVFDNDNRYPINANNVTVIPGWYFATTNGNYITITAQGNVVLTVTNSSAIGWNNLFIVSYRNNNTLQTKQAWLRIDFI